MPEVSRANSNVSDLIDVDKVKAESQKPEIAQAIEANHKLGEKLHIQGTPTLIVGDELIPHAAQASELEERLDAATK